jgi:hypothetical protein
MRTTSARLHFAFAGAIVWRKDAEAIEIMAQEGLEESSLGEDALDAVLGEGDHAGARAHSRRVQGGAHPVSREIVLLPTP